MNVALLGYGVVGSGAGECMAKHPMEGVRLARVFDGREIESVKDILVHDVNIILEDKEIDTVVEVMGGEHPAYEFVKASLLAGKNAVTSNKQMLSLHFDELVNIAREKGVSLAFSATAGGSIPWLHNLLRVKRVDNILSVGGVMNGTSNFILDAMQTDDSADFAEVLKEAQRRGYAEADPSADIDGLDVKAKIALSCDVAYGKMVDPAEIPALGVRYITRRDIAYFRTMGYNARLIGRAEEIDGDMAVYVEPMLFRSDAEEYNLSGAGNLIAYKCERIGKQAFYGLGAGKEPTGGAIVNDIYDIAAGISIFDTVTCDGRVEIKPEKAQHIYYVRTTAKIEESLIDKKLAEDVLITKRISVKLLHDTAKNIIAGGGEIFAASIAE